MKPKIQKGKNIPATATKHHPSSLLPASLNGSASNPSHGGPGKPHSSKTVMSSAAQQGRKVQQLYKASNQAIGGSQHPSQQAVYLGSFKRQNSLSQNKSASKQQEASFQKQSIDAQLKQVAHPSNQLREQASLKKQAARKEEDHPYLYDQMINASRPSHYMANPSPSSQDIHLIQQIPRGQTASGAGRAYAQQKRNEMAEPKVNTFIASTKNEGVVKTQMFLSHQTTDDATKARPKSSAPNQFIPQNFQFVQEQNARGQANTSHQSAAIVLSKQQQEVTQSPHQGRPLQVEIPPPQSVPNYSNLISNSQGPEGVTATQIIPQSANATQKKGNLIPRAEGGSKSGTAVGRARKQKVVNQSNQPAYAGKANVALPPSEDPWMFSQTQNINQNGEVQSATIANKNQIGQQVFFEKRNRSRGVATGSSSAIAAGVLVTMQTGKTMNQMRGGSPTKPVSHSTQKANPQMAMIGEKQHPLKKAEVKGSNKNFTLMNPNQIMNQIHNFNSGQQQPLPPQQILLLNSLQHEALKENIGEKSIGQADSVYSSQLPQDQRDIYSMKRLSNNSNLLTENAAHSERGTATPQGNQSNSKLEQIKHMSSYDRRQQFNQMSSATNSGGASHLLIQPNGTDIKNKENMTTKQNPRKATLISSTNAGSSHSIQPPSHISKQLNNLINIDQQSKGQAQLSSHQVGGSLPSSSKNGGKKGQAAGGTLHSLTNLNQNPSAGELSRDAPKEKSPLNFKGKQQLLSQKADPDFNTSPSTSTFFKRTYRHFFKRRAAVAERPILVIHFQGVLGDFFRDGGLSTKQDSIMSKQYLTSVANASADAATNQSCLWARIGVVDGLKYLAKHFQIVIYNKDTYLEDHRTGKANNLHNEGGLAPFFQVNCVQQYLNQNDITVDGIYSSSQHLQKYMDTAFQQQQTALTKKDREKEKERQRNTLKKPHKPGDIWEDYKQIYLDFGLGSDQQVRDRVLFICSLDSDFNAKHEEFRFDKQGYFLFDAKSKPARPLVEGLPLTYETKEKEIDLSDKGGMLQFNKLIAKKEVLSKEMPVTMLIPNPRTMYGQQISFASIAKTVMTMCFLGQKKKTFGDQDSLLTTYLSKIRHLQEFDVKVQKDKCLLQYNPSRQAPEKGMSPLYHTQKDKKKDGKGKRDSFGPSKANKTQNNFKSKMQKMGQTTNNLISVDNQSKGSNSSFNKMNQRPRSSNSQGNILSESGECSSESHQGSENMDIDLNNHETLQIPLTPQLFANISWAHSHDFISNQSREILGIMGFRSNLVWRYFVSQLKERSNIKQLREKRAAEVKKLFEKLDQLQNEEGKAKRQMQIQEIYDKLKKVQTNWNPLTIMMARNLKVFIKIQAEVRRKSKRELENLTEAILVDQKMAELEKQTLENRVFLLGFSKPTQYFNTHARVYEKVQLPSNSQGTVNFHQPTITKLFDNSGVNTNLQPTQTGGQSTQSQKGRAGNQLHYASISSGNNDMGLNNSQSTFEPTQRSLMENSLVASSKNAKSGGGSGIKQHHSSSFTGQKGQNYGKKKPSHGGKQSSGANSGTKGDNNQFSTQVSSSHMSRRKRKVSKGAEIVTEGSMTRRSNQSCSEQRLGDSGVF